MIREHVCRRVERGLEIPRSQTQAALLIEMKMRLDVTLQAALEHESELCLK